MQMIPALARDWYFHRAPVDTTLVCLLSICSQRGVRGFMVPIYQVASKCMFWRFSRSLFAPWFIIYWYHTGENATQVILSPVKGAGFSHSLIPCRSRAKQFTWRFGDTSPKMPLHTRQEIPSHEPITTFFTYVGPDFVIEWQRRCWSVYTVSFPTSPILRWYTKSDTVSERTESRREGL